MSEKPFWGNLFEKFGVIKTSEQKIEEEQKKIDDLITELKRIIPQEIIDEEVINFGKTHRLREETDPETRKKQNVVYKFVGKNLITEEEMVEKQGTVKERMSAYFQSFQRRYEGKAQNAQKADGTFSGAALRLLTIPEWVERIKAEEDRIPEEEAVSQIA